jgi:hypothetical protein
MVFAASGNEATLQPLSLSCPLCYPGTMDKPAILLFAAAVIWLSLTVIVIHYAVETGMLTPGISLPR